MDKHQSDSFGSKPVCDMIFGTSTRLFDVNVLKKKSYFFTGTTMEIDRCPGIVNERVKTAQTRQTERCSSRTACVPYVLQEERPGHSGRTSQAQRRSRSSTIVCRSPRRCPHVSGSWIAGTWRTPRKWLPNYTGRLYTCPSWPSNYIIFIII